VTLGRSRVPCIRSILPLKAVPVKRQKVEIPRSKLEGERKTNQFPTAKIHGIVPSLIWKVWGRKIELNQRLIINNPHSSASSYNLI
jgi:hypothetical protein